MSAPQANEAEKNIEIWKVKKLIKRLEAARGNGTSMISLIIRMYSARFLATRQIHRANSLQLPKIRFPAPQRCWLKNT
jgi:peptide subunit release factor 1 (eRF1)